MLGHSLRAATLVVALVTLVFAAPTNAQVDVRATLGNESAAILRPCIGGGTELPYVLTISNSSMNALSIEATITLSAGLQAVPDSCQASQPTCDIVGPSTVDYDTTVAAQTTAFAAFLARVDQSLPPGTQLCVTASVVVDSDAPVVVQDCTFTTQTQNCGLSAPTVGPIGIGLLLLALLAGGIRLARRLSA
jgi:hypothetical protein